MRTRHLAVLLGLALTGCGPARGRQQCPTVAEIAAYEPPEASRVFAVDGSFLADLSPHRRVLLDYEQVPAVLSRGFVAVEDRRFWRHGGIDYRGIVRAVVKDATTLSLRQGFSTITMQLPRNIFRNRLPMSSKFGRKLCEVHLAPQIEERLGKREILTLYMNQIYLGDGAYGIEAAARTYFGKPVGELSTAEAALLIGLARSPEGYDPRRHPTAAVRRRNTVLSVLARENVISAEEARRARGEPVILAPPVEATTRAPYFIAALRAELRQRFGEDADVKGLRVYTGLDPALQQTAAEALRSQLGRIERGWYGTFRHPVPEQQPLAPATGGGSPYLQGMVVVLEPRTGAVRALVGGRDFRHSQFDRALKARRQPGSAFKPIVYAAALEQGLTPATRIATAPVGLAFANAHAWSPDDHVPDSVATLPVRDALALSSNNVAVRIGQMAGAPRVIALAHAMGISTPIPPYPSIFLGAAEVVPIELVAAYGAFGNNGMRVYPHLIVRVEDGAGRLLWAAPPNVQRVLDPDAAFLTLSMMQDVVDRGTATSIRRDGFLLPAAGKTGTTNGVRDSWFVGLTPDLVGGVWIGFDRPSTIVPGRGGGSLAAPIWAEVMKAAYRQRPAEAGWPAPPDIVSVPIDVESGALATANCPPEQVRIEYFRPGTEPRDFCPLHPETGLEHFFDRLWHRLTDRGT